MQNISIRILRIFKTATFMAENVGLIVLYAFAGHLQNYILWANLDPTKKALQMLLDCTFLKPHNFVYSTSIIMLVPGLNDS